MSLKKGSSKKPDWLPDWKDITKYPDPEKVTGRVWAWEFLRRNPQYQQLWEESAALPKSVGFIYHESFSNLEKRLEITERFEKEFGVRAPAPPSMASTDPDFEWRPMFIDQHIKHRMKPVGWPEDEEPYLIDEVLHDPAEVVIWFNLRWPLAHQVEAAEKLLEGQENSLLAREIIDDNNHKMKSQHFQDYLRISDAAAMGAAPKEIAETIFGFADEYPDHKGQQRVSHALKRAKWLRDAGFRFLIAPQP